jgi:hypothetical protein
VDDGNGNDERRETPGHHQQAVGLSSPGHTRESSPMSGENPEDTDLTNPMVESSKFMSSSTGRSCEHSQFTTSIELTSRESILAPPPIGRFMVRS